MSKNISFYIGRGFIQDHRDLIKPKKSSKKGPETGQKRALEPEPV